MNLTRSPYGATFDPRVQESAKGIGDQPPYRKRVGVYADVHAHELHGKEDVPDDPPAPAPPRPDPKADLPPPCPCTSVSVTELREQMKRNIAYVWDPEDRFKEPPTAQMEVGWGARKQPKDACVLFGQADDCLIGHSDTPSVYVFLFLHGSVRYPIRVSEMTKTAALLRQAHGPH